MSQSQNQGVCLEAPCANLRWLPYDRFWYYVCTYDATISITYDFELLPLIIVDK